MMQLVNLPKNQPQASDRIGGNMGDLFDEVVRLL